MGSWCYLCTFIINKIINYSIMIKGFYICHHNQLVCGYFAYCINNFFDGGINTITFLCNDSNEDQSYEHITH